MSFILYALFFSSVTVTVFSAALLSTFCPANKTWDYTTNSPFELNLKTLLDYLPKITSNSGFYNGSIGTDPDRVYAQSLCRGDVSASDCELCVRNASLEILRQCKTVEATIWFDLCQVRYSYYMFFPSTTYAGKPGKNQCNNNTVDPMITSTALTSLMNKLLLKAAYSSSKMFAVGESKVSNQTIYGLVQCTRDISPDDCRLCLVEALGDLDGWCSLHRGGIVLSYTCNMRFESYRFYSVIKGRSKAWVLIVSIVVPTLVIFTVIACCSIYYWKRKKIQEGNRIKTVLMSALTIPKDVVVTEEGNFISTEGLPFMDLATLKDATNNFCDSKLLGQGGFGAVYEGLLPNGTKVAVKRLARRTWQGAEEFKNEIILIANLQHRNLVRLLGCGIEGQEKILVYELLPQKSLDLYIYDAEKRAELNWETRFNIIKGIARGLLYLHEGSRLRIIHRDLKPSNVLLDQDMTAKISDFGIARIFCDDQNTATTKRVVGTYGYMAPEYAMEGLFSGKSDVFSYGIIVLEIISGIRSSRYLKEYSKSLVAYTWKLWNEGKELELVDSLLAVPYSMEEVLRCLHIALLCVQEDPAERPAMANVVSLLSGESLTLPQPKSPALYVGHDHDKMMAIDCSVNELTISTISPR